jgi:hypothetical protein
MTSTIPTNHEELGRLKQADVVREVQRCQFVPDAAEVRYQRPASKFSRQLMLPARVAAHLRLLALGREGRQA